MKLIALIPARLSSKRFPYKVLHNIHGLPMIEHVRRHVLMTKIFSEVIVVTPNEKLKKKIQEWKGKVLLNNKRHFSGTSRAAEVISKIKGDIFVIIFADEPLLLPAHIKSYCKYIKKDKKAEAWNATTKLDKNDESSKNVVKCTVDKNNFIRNFYRSQRNNYNNLKTLKSVGIMAFKRKLILNYKKIKKSRNEISLSIEQFRFIDNNIALRSILLNNVYPSINSANDLNKALKGIKNSYVQKATLKKTLDFI